MMFVVLFLKLLIVACVYTPVSAADSPPGKWQSRAPMPSARTEVAAAQTGGKIYVIGGLEKHGDRVEEYNPVTNSWRRRASLPHPLHHLGATGANGKIYVIGGYISGVGPVDTVYEYDPASDRWRARLAMPTARGALSVGVIAGKIFAVGGVGTNKKNTGANEEYDPAQDRWSRRAPMPTPEITTRSASLARNFTPSPGAWTASIVETSR